MHTKAVCDESDTSDLDQAYLHTAARLLQEQKRGSYSRMQIGEGHSGRLFQHLSRPEPALREMVRVTRRGGRVAVLDTDWGTRSIDALDVALERRRPAWGSPVNTC